MWEVSWFLTWKFYPAPKKGISVNVKDDFKFRIKDVLKGYIKVGIDSLDKHRLDLE